MRDRHPMVPEEPAAQARSQPFHNVLITINPGLPGQPARWAAWVP